MLKETFKMRKIGKHLVNVSMLSLAIAPVVGSVLAPVTVLAAEYKSGQDGSNKLEFMAKSTTTTSTKTGHEPMDLIQIVDLSGSLSDGEFKSRFGYTGARRQQLTDMIYVIQNKLTDQDHVMLAFYGTNNQTSYETNGQDGAAVTKLLSKSEALDILKQLVNNNQVMEMAQSWTLIPNIVEPLLGDKAIKIQDHKGFEQIYQEQPNKNKVVSALQFTDDWTNGEDIDSSFADWAKNHAKTFMTVVDGGGGSVQKMKNAGHPNVMVFGLTDRNKQGRSEEIAKQFESTATVTTSHITKQKGHITITPEVGVTLKTAELVDPSGKKTPLTIKDNKVSVDTGDLNDGKYVVNYTFGGSVDSAKKITSSVTVDGKEVDKKEDTILPVAKPTKRIEKIPFQTETKEDPTLPEGEKKVVQKGVEGEREITTTMSAGDAGEFELTKESTAVKNADGSYTQKIQIAYDTTKIVPGYPGSFHIDGAKDTVKLLSIKLTDPYGEEVPLKGDGFARPYLFSRIGVYTLTYNFVPQKRGEIKGTFTIGANTVTKTDAFVELEGKPSTNETDKIIKQPVNEIIHIGTNGSKSEVTEKKIPFETIKKEDPTLEEGQEKVVQEGVEGVIKVTTTYETQKGENVKGSEKVTEEKVTDKVDKIIAVGTKGSKSEVTEKKVPFETIYKQDPSLKKGEEKVLQEGVEGVIKVTTTYETQKGQKVDGSEKVTEETVTEKVDKIVAQGTMEKRKVRYRVVDSKGQELVKQTDVMEAYQDEQYKVETPKLDGYRLELAKDSVPATGKVADRDVLVTFVAVKIGKPVTLKFVDESGSEIAQKKVLTGENAEVDTEFTGEAPETIEKDGVKYAFVGIKQTGSKERKVSGKVTDQEQVIEAVYAKPKELPKTSEQVKQRNTAIIALLSVVGFGGLATYLGLRKRDEK